MRPGEPAPPPSPPVASAAPVLPLRRGPTHRGASTIPTASAAEPTSLPFSPFCPATRDVTSCSPLYWPRRQRREGASTAL